MAGRVGDSAIIGAGVFAGESGAASATGHGEAIIIAGLCREAVAALAGAPPGRVAPVIIARLIAPQGCEAGIILIDRKGRIGYAHNAESMEVGTFHAQSGIAHAWARPIAGKARP